jgi:alpha-soluble NSF attachment protein
MRFSVKDFFFKAGICHLATKVRSSASISRSYCLSNFVNSQDLVATNRALESYRDIDPTFTSTRENQLLTDLTEAVEHGDQEAFSDKLFQFDQLSRLDKWKTALFVRIKDSIEEAGEDFS